MTPKPLRYRDPANVPAHLVALMPKPRKLKTKKNDTEAPDIDVLDSEDRTRLCGDTEVPTHDPEFDDTDTITDEEREHDLLAQPGMNITTEEIQ